MNLSTAGLDRIKSYEACRLEAYPDVVGVWTIGWGHAGPDVHAGLTWTQDECDWALLQDVSSSIAAVNRLVAVPLTQGEFDALVDFCYNVGQGNLASSTMLRKLNAGDYNGAADEFDRWDMAGGKVSSGLLRRRQNETSGFKA